MTATATTAPPVARSSHRRRDIQGLRAFAVVVVILFHAGLPVPGGFVGVDVFFVISGFVITAMLMREWANHGRIRFGTFYLRRFRRLTPALALTVSVTMLLAVFLLSPLGPQETAAETGLGAMFIVANFVIAATTGGYFDAPAETNPLLNTWSLSVEEQFYIFFPALLALGWFLGRRRFKQAPAFIIVSVIAVASFGLTLLPSTSMWLGFYSPVTRAWEFAIGALLALAAIKIRSVGVATVLGAVGLVALLASLWLIDGETPFPGPWTLLPTVGALLVILAGSNEANPISRGFGWSPFVATGDASYSLYLWHWPIIVFAALTWPAQPWLLPLAAAVSVIPAVLSYRYLEQPIRQSRGRVPLLLCATMLPPLILAGGLWFASAQGFWSPRIQSYKAATESESAAARLGCDDGKPASELPPECLWNTDSDGRPIVLLGDSNGAHFSDALIDVSDSTGRPLTIATNTACPFIDLKFDQSAFNGSDKRQCRAFIRKTLDWLDEQPPSTVIISSSDRIWESSAFVLEPDNARGGTPEGQRLLRAALLSTVERIQAAGHTVILVQTVPHWGRMTGEFRTEYAFDPTECTTFEILSGNCAQSMTIAFAEGRHAAARDAINDVAARTGATVIDFFPTLCPDGMCSTTQGEIFAYRDSTHLTPEMSLLLAPEFAAFIERSSGS